MSARAPAVKRPLYDWEAECLFELEAFVELVDDGAVSDYDGSGFWADADGVYDVEVCLTMLERQRDRPEGATHVAWYSK